MYNDPATWRLSRNFLEQQIRILRVQLDELKVIRKHLKAMRPAGSGEKLQQKINKKQRTKSKSPLFDWSSPLSANRTLANASDDVIYQQRPSANRKKQQPKAPSRQEEDEDDDDDQEEEDDDDEEEPTAGPVDIEVTIYDNRKIK